MCIRDRCRPIDLIGGPVFESLVPAPQVVEVEVGGKLPPGFGNALVSFQVHLLVFHAPPEPALGVERLNPHPAYERGQVDLVHGGHQGKVRLARRYRLALHARAGEAEKLGLPGNRQGLPFVDHRFALVPLMRPSAPDKKSFSMVSSPILACSSAMQGPPSLSCSPSPKTAAAPSKSCRFHLVIWLGWTSNRSAMVMRGSSPLIASRATLALNTGEWLRLGLLGIVHTPPGRLPRSSITYRAVQFRPATSLFIPMRQAMRRVNLREWRIDGNATLTREPRRAGAIR